MATPFKKGTFKNYRSTTKIHLGKLNIYLEKNQIISFDGQTLKMGDGTQHNLPQLQGAIKSDWIVPEKDKKTTYKAKPSGIKIRDAKKAGDESKKTTMTMTVAHDEERVVGTVKSAATDTGNAQGATDGVAVARIESPTKRTTTLMDSSQVNTEIQKMDNKAAPKVIKVATAGDDITDLVDDAAVAGVVDTTPKTTKNSKVTLLGNGDQWDMSQHWRTRGRNAFEKYANNPSVLDEIKSIEIKSVVKFINEKMDKLN